MSKLNVGSRVKLKNSEYSSEELSSGKTGVIVSVDRYHYCVVMDSLYQRGGDAVWPFYPHELELVEAE